MLNQKNDVQDDVVQEGKLLSAQERVAFRMISTGNDLHGQRALALLAIDEGATRAQAAQRAGLTPSQVKYWLGKFREIRLAIFPDQVLEAAGQRSQPEMAVEPTPTIEKSQKKGKKKKAKDTKKKKAKKSKKKKTKKVKKQGKKSKAKQGKDEDKKKNK